MKGLIAELRKKLRKLGQLARPLLQDFSEPQPEEPSLEPIRIPSPEAENRYKNRRHRGNNN